MDTKVSSMSRRGFLKGLAVGAGGYALGPLLIHPQEAMGQSIEGYLEKVPVETRWDLASGAYVTWYVSHSKTLYDQGSKERFIEFMKQTGRTLAAGYKGFADRFGFSGNDAKSAATIIPAITTVFFGPRQKYEIEEVPAEKARVKCINCVFWNAAQAQKITDDLCSALSLYSWEGRAKAINPKLTSTLVKARPFGDSVCEWVLELKT